MENKQEWYKPSEIAKKQLIRRKFGSNEYHSLYRFIIAAIKDGSLPAQIWAEQGVGTDNHRVKYMVNIADIEAFQATQA